ncbi:BnaC03g47670D [Brassica napus]|uniref:BnaC03g47670D protein n=1 Tax=Brassica napus TaxID=3708 RepID=A0A078F0A9_BRANA|nr:BnaC03g47670D [Brassica napus]
MEQFPILSLPPEVQGFVVKLVAHTSFEDLFRLRATCKAMHSLADDEDGHWALWDIDNRKAEDMCNRCFWIKEVGLFLRDFKASTGHPNFETWR